MTTGLLEQGIAALNANTVAVNELLAHLKAGGSAPATAAKAADEPASEAPKNKPGRPRKDNQPKVTFDEMKASLFKVRDEKGAPAASQIIKDVGKADAMKNVKEDLFAAVIAACEAALAPADDDLGGGSEENDGL